MQALVERPEDRMVTTTRLLKGIGAGPGAGNPGGGLQVDD